jgi:hypothetical protein
VTCAVYARGHDLLAWRWRMEMFPEPC